jgi:preprotein translocase subunit SecA
VAFPVPSVEYHALTVTRPKPLPKGLDALAHTLVGSAGRRKKYQNGLWEQVRRVEAGAGELVHLSDRHLRDRLEEFRDAFRRRRGPVPEQIPPALAAICEAAARTVGLRPYPVQILGALAMQDGRLAEMATGEGKTLTAALAAVLAGWTHLPCHVLTVNDYLAQRDAENYRPLYQFCGLKVDFVTGLMESDQRRRAYGAHICYTTSKEVLADFLRDRLQLQRVADPQRRLIRHLVRPHRSREGLVLRGLHTAIVDEADSILIDEAVTPLIIAQPRANPMLIDACMAARDLAEQLQPGQHYTVDYRYREVKLTEAGKKHIATLVEDLPPVWRGVGRSQALLQQAITARELFLKGSQYVIQDDKIMIVDEFTGRIMPNRSWSEGLHQAIECKEGLEITEPNETVARMSFQRFFRLYPKICGMTGTAWEARFPLWRIYGLPVVRIPTNKPCIRQVLPERIFATREEKWAAVADDVERMHRLGRPVLVGTRSVEASEELAVRLDAKGLEYNLLNAVRHAEEARIIAEAGLEAKITIATNMAGRGTDIKLGRDVAEAGGLHVIMTERHEARRIDRQLFGRAARQGDPGSAQSFVSLEDELFRRFVPEAVRKSLAGLSGGAARKPFLAALDAAQRAAERHAFRGLKSVLGTDTWLEESLSFAEDAGSR